MKTKNVKVRMQDIKQGATIYVAHPVYGINKYIIKGKPFLSKYTNSLFVKAVWDGHNIEVSLVDAGITSTYNDYRSFFKLKHAKAWEREWASNKGFIHRQAEHERFCESLNSLFDYYMDFE